MPPSSESAGRYQEAKRLFQEALALPSEQREGFLREIASRDPEMAGRVETLLAHDAETRTAAGPSASSGTGGAEFVGPYRLIREIGRGGQGIVYLADDTRIHRRVALKVLQGMASISPDSLARFRREAEAASRLHHPGICSVYEAAMDGQVPYIAMRYVEGESLAAKIAASRGSGADSADTSCVQLSEILDAPAAQAIQGKDPSPTPAGPTTRAEIMRVVQLIEKVARALHAAHEAGVIHRDMKPGNIMITPEGEAVIMDFGLAHLEDEQLPTLTKTGEFFGTPAYMSPEQLLMVHRVHLDQRTDVWSLGVMLYESVTLARPFDAPTREGLYQAIQTREPSDPRDANHAVSRDLQIILETALEKNRDRRYQTALALAEDLRRVRVYEPIAARPAGPIYRFRRWVQRHPVQAAPVFTLIGLLIFQTWLLNDALAELRYLRSDPLRPTFIDTSRRKPAEGKHQPGSLDDAPAETEVLRKKVKDRESEEAFLQLMLKMVAESAPATGPTASKPTTRDAR